MNLFTIRNFQVYQNIYEKNDFEIKQEILQVTIDKNFFTLTQIFKEIEDKYFSYLNPIFDNSDDLEFFTTDKELQKNIFKIMDANYLGRLDGFELLSFIHFAVTSELEDVIENFISEISIEENEYINRDFFFYYFDALFRSFPKVIQISQNCQNQIKGSRLNYLDLEELTELVFKQKDQIHKNDAIKFFCNNKKNEYIKFLEHIKKTINQNLKRLQKKLDGEIQNSFEIQNSIEENLNENSEQEI